MVRLCGRCKTPFHPSRHNKTYCQTCMDLAQRPRICAHCGDTYKIVTPARLDSSKYCKNKCRLAAVRQSAIDGAAKARTERGRINVQCALAKSGQCPQPDKLIPVVRSVAADNHYHKPACLAVFRAGGIGRVHLSKREERFCKTCPQSLGLRYPSCRTEHCRDCARTLQKGQPKARRAGNLYQCAARGCSTRVYVAPWQAKMSTTGDFYCENHDGRRARRTVVTVRCTVCNSRRGYYESKVPQTVDLKTLTWTCLACRPYKTVWRRFVCAECHAPFARRVKVAGPDPDVRFCKAACRKTYYRKVREQANPCRQCGGVIKRRGRCYKGYCKMACYTAAKTGQPRPHYRPSKAELRILAAWVAGTRGVRPLAVVSGTSKSTVQKLVNAGKIAS